MKTGSTNLKKGSGIETMPLMPEKRKSRVIVEDTSDDFDSQEARFSEEEGFSDEPEKSNPTKGKVRIVQDGQTDQGYRPMPNQKPPRRNVMNETDSRDWRREYQKEYRMENQASVAELTTQLDKVAALLEEKGLTDHAETLDKVANTLESTPFLDKALSEGIKGLHSGADFQNLIMDLNKVLSGPKSTYLHPQEKSTLENILRRIDGGDPEKTDLLETALQIVSKVKDAPGA